MNNSSPGKGMAIASMVLGICAIVIPESFIAIICAIVGLVLGISGKRKLREIGAPTSMATAGIVMSVIALVLAVVLIAGLIAALSYLFRL